MKRNSLVTTAFTTLALITVLAAAGQAHAQAQNATSTNPTMAPLDQYLMDRNAEIALARSAAPESISKDAEVLVFGAKGYETAVQGKNGFVCLVHRSWTSESKDPEFWNPKRRGPMCLNAAAAKSYLPNTVMRTNLVLAGRSKDQVFEAIKTALENGKLPPLEHGAMCYMMSRQGHLSDRDGHWHPHVMFFLTPAEGATWGASGDDSPFFEDDDAADRMTVMMIPVSKWSDGTADSMAAH